MNWGDIIIIIVLAILTILGLKRGLVKSLFPLIGIVLGIFLAGTFQNALADNLGFIDSEGTARIVAFAIILVVVFLAAIIAGSIVHGILHMVLLGWVDRLGGAVFGFALGWFICSAVIVLLARYVALPVEIPEFLHLEGVRNSIYNAIEGSALATAQIDSFPVVLGLLPEEFDAVKDFFGK